MIQYNDKTDIMPSLKITGYEGFITSEMRVAISKRIKEAEQLQAKRRRARTASPSSISHALLNEDCRDDDDKHHPASDRGTAMDDGRASAGGHHQSRRIPDLEILEPVKISVRHRGVNAHRRTEDNEDSNSERSDQSVSVSKIRKIKMGLRQRLFPAVALQSFDAFMDDLMEYKNTFGHSTPVLQGELYRKQEDPNLHLIQWCSDLRLVYQRFYGTETNGNSKHLLTEERCKSLQNLGFDLDRPHHPDTASNFDYTLKSFDVMLDELKSFKEEFGHCDVPLSNNPVMGPYYFLGRWCNESLRMAEKGPCGILPRVQLSYTRIKSLNDLGFDWDLRNNIEEEINEPFELFLEEVIAFKTKFMRSDFSLKLARKNLALGKLFSLVRQSYHKNKHGRNGAFDLTMQEFQRLQDKGFTLCLP